MTMTPQIPTPTRAAWSPPWQVVGEPPRGVWLLGWVVWPDRVGVWTPILVQDDGTPTMTFEETPLPTGTSLVAWAIGPRGPERLARLAAEVLTTTREPSP